MSHLIQSSTEIIAKEFRPFRPNLFEAVLLRSSGVDVRKSAQSGTGAGSFIPTREPVGIRSTPGSESPFFFRFLIEEMSFETGSIEIKEHPTKRSLFITNATPPRRLSIVVRETVDIQVFRIFRDIFVKMYNPFTGLYGGYVPLTLFVGTYDTLEFPAAVGDQRREKTNLVLTNVFAFRDCFLLNFPVLSLKWNEKGIATHTIQLAFSIMDYVSLKTLVNEVDSRGSGKSRISSLEEFILSPDYGQDFIENGAFTKAAEHSASAASKRWDPAPEDTTSIGIESEPSS